MRQQHPYDQNFLMKLRLAPPVEAGAKLGGVTSSSVEDDHGSPGLGACKRSLSPK
jgi:hypothetical protein